MGSITHCAEYQACAVARASDIVTIGLDAEPHDRLPGGVLAAVALGEERAGIAALTAGRPAVCWVRVLFSAKESVYKAWFRLTQRWLGFEQTRIDFDPAAGSMGSFTAELLTDGSVVNGRPLTGFRGRWLVSHGLILTSIVIARDNQPRGSSSPAGRFL